MLYKKIIYFISILLCNNLFSNTSKNKKSNYCKFIETSLQETKSLLSKLRDEPENKGSLYCAFEKIISSVTNSDEEIHLTEHMSTQDQNNDQSGNKPLLASKEIRNNFNNTDDISKSIKTFIFRLLKLKNNLICSQKTNFNQYEMFLNNVYFELQHITDPKILKEKIEEVILWNQGLNKLYCEKHNVTMSCLLKQFNLDKNKEFLQKLEETLKNKLLMIENINKKQTQFCNFFTLNIFKYK